MGFVPEQRASLYEVRQKLLSECTREAFAARRPDDGLGKKQAVRCTTCPLPLEGAASRKGVVRVQQEGHARANVYEFRANSRTAGNSSNSIGEE